jgi:serine/threonine-protein kinase HipA
VAERLLAWLYGSPVAVLRPRANYRIALEWHEQAISRWGRGSRILSVSLPIGSPIGPRDDRGLDFFENLLPEGPALARLAALAQVPTADTFGILAAFGRDCAGAISLLPDGEEPQTAEHGDYVRASEDDLAQLINDLGSAPLGASPERGFRPSLAGFQRKALVGRAEDGTWLLPRNGAPSTWILKPDGPQAMAANESTCLRLAAVCGLEVPETELFEQSGRPVLAIRRYDRTQEHGGPVRIHQEDGCQAAAKPPALKYQEHGGPSLADLATVLRDFGDPADVPNLLRRTAFNMAIGNADAHAKNFSILHHADRPAVKLAPLYDTLSTIALDLTDATGRPVHAETSLGQRVGSQTDVRAVTASDLVNEALKWGIRRQAGSDIVNETMDQVIGAAASQTGDERTLDAILAQAQRMGWAQT